MQAKDLKKYICKTYVEKHLCPQYIKYVNSSTMKRQKTHYKGSDLNRHDTKENIQITSKHMRRCLVSFAIK